MPTPITGRIARKASSAVVGSRFRLPDDLGDLVGLVLATHVRRRALGGGQELHQKDDDDRHPEEDEGKHHQAAQDEGEQPVALRTAPDRGARSTDRDVIGLIR